MVDSSQPSRNPAQSSGDMTGAMTEILGKFLKSSIDDMLPARVVSYDREKNRASVKILIAMVRTDGTPVSREALASVPVINIGGGGFIMSFNMVPGDLGWIKASDRDLAEFLKFYKESAPATKRVHSFDNGLFFPDVMTGYNIAEEDAGNAVFQSLDGTVKIALFPDKIKMTAPLVEIDAANSNFTGNITAEGDVSDGTGSLNGLRGNYNSATYLGNLGNPTSTTSKPDPTP